MKRCTLFDELVPPEVRPTLRRACEALRGVDVGLQWALALGIASAVAAQPLSCPVLQWNYRGVVK